MFWENEHKLLEPTSLLRKEKTARQKHAQFPSHCWGGSHSWGNSNLFYPSRWISPSKVWNSMAHSALFSILFHFYQFGMLSVDGPLQDIRSVKVDTAAVFILRCVCVLSLIKDKDNQNIRYERATFRLHAKHKLRRASYWSFDLYQCNVKCVCRRQSTASISVSVEGHERLCNSLLAKHFTDLLKSDNFFQLVKMCNMCSGRSISFIRNNFRQNELSSLL